MAPQIQRLRAGAEIVVACPGRLLDHLNQGTISLSNIEMLVIDEADRMFDMGFLPSVRQILGYVPAQRQTMMFSATFPREIERLAQEAGLRVANVFHAGDGNLHPLVLYDARVGGQEQRAEHLGGEILRMCVRYGGSITGEHGVGLAKRDFVEYEQGAELVALQRRLKALFDPLGILNPGKMFPER